MFAKRILLLLVTGSVICMSVGCGMKDSKTQQTELSEIKIEELVQNEQPPEDSSDTSDDAELSDENLSQIIIREEIEYAHDSDDEFLEGMAPEEGDPIINVYYSNMSEMYKDDVFPVYALQCLSLETQEYLNEHGYENEEEIRMISGSIRKVSSRTMFDAELMTSHQTLTITYNFVEGTLSFEIN